MSIYERFASRAHQVEPVAGETSYLSAPEDHLDPYLFTGMVIRPQVRQAILSIYFNRLVRDFHAPETWSRVWLAGSGVSYQWSAARDPGDLDCLVGVDMIQFRNANRDFADLSDDEIATMLNNHWRELLAEYQHNWHGYDLTVYCNPGAWDIRDIHPYAAYSLTDNDWTVHPDPNPHAPDNPEFRAVVDQDFKRGQEILARYNRAVEEHDGVNNAGLRLNAAITLRTAAQEAASLFDEIHLGRHAAFDTGGAGYADLANYRWQLGKANGIIPALKQVKDDLGDAWDEEQGSLYGRPLPDYHETLIADAYRSRQR